MNESLVGYLTESERFTRFIRGKTDNSIFTGREATLEDFTHNVIRTNVLNLLTKGWAVGQGYWRFSDDGTLMRTEVLIRPS